MRRHVHMCAYSLCFWRLCANSTCTWYIYPCCINVVVHCKCVLTCGLCRCVCSCEVVVHMYVCMLSWMCTCATCVLMQCIEADTLPRIQTSLWLLINIWTTIYFWKGGMMQRHSLGPGCYSWDLRLSSPRAEESPYMLRPEPRSGKGPF